MHEGTMQKPYGGRIMKSFYDVPSAEKVDA